MLAGAPRAPTLASAEGTAHALVAEVGGDLVVHLLVHGLRHQDVSRLREPLQARGDVHAVAVDLVLLDDHVAHVHADARLDPALRWH
jgi:hypothetical protein